MAFFAPLKDKILPGKGGKIHLNVLNNLELQIQTLVVTRIRHGVDSLEVGNATRDMC